MLKLVKENGENENSLAKQLRAVEPKKIKRETEPKTASASKLVSRLFDKVSNKNDKLVKAEQRLFRVRM